MTTESPSQKPPYRFAIVGPRRSPVGFEHRTNSQAVVQRNRDTPGRAVKQICNRTSNFGVRQFPNLGRISGTVPSWIAFTALLLLVCSPVQATQANSGRPNIVLVMIDDMGYGDLSCHGSPFIATPHLDQLHSSSIRLTDFHVAPMCSPTRGQLLTGLDAMRNGSTIVAGSRMMVRQDVPMLPAHLAAAGYATGIFGKWHLGENYPHRPQDRGFQQVLTFGLQEIGSLADHWCNDYFDPVLRTHEGPPPVLRLLHRHLLRPALQWMRSGMPRDSPFLLPTAECSPWPQCASRNATTHRRPVSSTLPWSSRLPGHAGQRRSEHGTARSLPRRIGTARQHDRDFLSDNGGYALIGHYNAGMREANQTGRRWPSRPLLYPLARRQVRRQWERWELTGLTQVQDLLPTLLELCAAPPVAGTIFDGLSLAAALQRRGHVPDRTLIVQYGLPEPFRMSCVMQGPWRLLSDIRGRAMGAPELYNLDQDPLQLNNLYDSHPEQAQRLRAAYDRWWTEVEPHTPASLHGGWPSGSAAGDAQQRRVARGRHGQCRAIAGGRRPTAQCLGCPVRPPWGL